MGEKTELKAELRIHFRAGKDSWFGFKLDEAVDFIFARAQPTPQDQGSLPDGWRPIETAPRDGTRVVAWPCELASGTAAVPAYWYRHAAVQGWITDLMDCGDFEFAPTRWMPVPTSSALSEGG